jgi:NADH-quinone oxidoreductase subunit K
MFISFSIVSWESIPLMVCLNFSFTLFVIGLVGIVFNKKSFLIMLLCIELMFFSISLNFIFFSLYSFNIMGQLYALLIVTTAAAETSIGLSLLVLTYRLGDKLNYRSLISCVDNFFI